MGSRTRYLRNEKQKNLVKLFDAACYRHNRGMAWSDFMLMAAIAVANLVDRSNAEEREKLYLQLAGKYDQKELTCFAEMFAEIVYGLEEDPDQDFLGELFMTLELSSAFNGQFFTPYNLCSAMARCAGDGQDLRARIEAEGWISVNDPACGAGALLVAFANWCRENGVNYQTSVLFAAQDIDRTVACMCYLQLSLLGCPGYVVVDNTLTHPSVCLDSRGLIPVHGPDVWYTPMYFREEWHLRRTAWHLDQVLLTAAGGRRKAQEPAPVREEADGQLRIF